MKLLPECSGTRFLSAFYKVEDLRAEIGELSIKGRGVKPV
jgi:hypothetical protein